MRYSQATVLLTPLVLLTSLIDTAAEGLSPSKENSNGSDAVVIDQTEMARKAGLGPATGLRPGD